MIYDPIIVHECAKQLEEHEEVLKETKPIDTEQIDMWFDISESLMNGIMGVYEKKKLNELITVKIENLKGNV